MGFEIDLLGDAIREVTNHPSTGIIAIQEAIHKHRDRITMLSADLEIQQERLRSYMEARATLQNAASAEKKTTKSVLVYGSPVKSVEIVKGIVMDPETWAATVGVKQFPEAIYFIAEITTDLDET